MKNTRRLNGLARNFAADTDDIRSPADGVANIDVEFSSSMVWISANQEGTWLCFSNNTTSANRPQWKIGAPIVAGHRYRFIHNATGTNPDWTSDTDQTDDIYQHLVVTWDRTPITTVPTFFIDGVADTTTTTITGSGNPRVGQDNYQVNDNSGDTAPCRGLMAFVTNWNVILPATLIAVMARGVNPFVIDRDNLIINLPIIGIDSPEPEFKQLDVGTVAGTPAKAANPPVELLENYL